MSNGDFHVVDVDAADASPTRAWVGLSSRATRSSRVGSSAMMLILLKKAPAVSSAASTCESKAVC